MQINENIFSFQNTFKPVTSNSNNFYFHNYINNFNIFPDSNIQKNNQTSREFGKEISYLNNLTTFTNQENIYKNSFFNNNNIYDKSINLNYNYNKKININEIKERNIHKNQTQNNLNFQFENNPFKEQVINNEIIANAFMKIDNNSLMKSEEKKPIINDIEMNNEEKEEKKLNNNPQEVNEYFTDIYNNLLQEEKNFIINPNYMSFQNDINEKMRAILIDWIIEVHYKYHFKRKTLLQTVTIIDLYLSNKTISKKNFQLLGIASLLISCKENEMYYPRTQEFIYMTNNAYTKNELLKMEAHVLNILNFEILSPSADEFYNILSKCFSFNKEQKFLGEYFMDSSLIDYKMLKYTPSIIATACAYIVMKFYGIKKYKDLYSSNMVMMDSPQKAIKDCARDLCFFVKNLSNSSLKATKEKYSLEQFGKVSDLCEEKK